MKEGKIMARETSKTGATLVFTVILLFSGLYFLYDAVNLITAETPQVAGGLLATVIGLSLVSAGVTLLRTWIIATTATSSEDKGEG